MDVERSNHQQSRFQNLHRISLHKKIKSRFYQICSLTSNLTVSCVTETNGPNTFTFTFTLSYIYNHIKIIKCIDLIRIIEREREGEGLINESSVFSLLIIAFILPEIWPETACFLGEGGRRRSMDSKIYHRQILTMFMFLPSMTV